MEEIFYKIFTYIIGNYHLNTAITMSIIISLTIVILMFIKKPIKKLTAKIANERLRKLVNKMFIIFAFAISALGWFGIVCIVPWFSFEPVIVLLTGAFSIVIYALGDGVIGKSSAIELIDKITDFAEEKSVSNDKTETENKIEEDAIKDFWNKVK